MIRLTPSVPEGCEVTGRIYWDRNAAMLGEDMLDVLLPNGVLVSCGWYPESSPSGSFRITASEGFDERRRVETRDPHAALDAVETLVRAFYGPGCWVRTC